eukprot:1274895-Amphidinium_carterae.1
MRASWLEADTDDMTQSVTGEADRAGIVCRIDHHASRSHQVLMSDDEAPENGDVETASVQGGARVGRLARRSFRKGLLSAKNKEVERVLTIHVARGQDVVVPFRGVISTLELLTICAKAKRVGRGYLALHWLRESGKRSFRSDTLVHETRTWAGQTLVLENQRHVQLANREGPSTAEYGRDHASLEVQFARDHGTDQDRKRARRHLNEAISRLDPRRASHGDECDEREDDEATSHVGRSSIVPINEAAAKNATRQDSEKPIQVLKMELKGEIHIPVSWNAQTIRQRLAARFQVDPGRVTVYRSCTGSGARQLARVSGATIAMQPWVQGAGRSQRVGQQSLETVVMSKLRQDVLISPAIVTVETRLLEHMLRADHKHTRAAFQARSIPQRLDALAAAFQRAGLQDLGRDTCSAAGEHRRQLQAANIEEEAVSSPGEGSATSRERRIPASPVAPQPASTRTSGSSIEELERKIKAIELWAHAVDATQEALPSQDTICATIVRTLEARMKELAEEQVKSFFEARTNQAFAKILTVLPLTPHGLVIEHCLVKEVLDKDNAAVQDILSAESNAQLYKGLARALHRSGQRRLALGLAKAAEGLMGENTQEEDIGHSQSMEIGGLETEMWTALTEAELESYQSLDMQGADDDEGDAEETATADPYQQIEAPRKRGRPAGPAKREQKKYTRPWPRCGAKWRP